jgi:DNA-binding IclR family transcriptional regulator
MYLSESELKKLLDTINLVAYTEHTITNRFNLLSDLEVTRERGWSLNKQENTLGVISVGAPIYSGGWGVPSGAICVDVPTARIPDDNYLEQLAAEVVKTAQAISNVGNYNKLE